jgi:hypothetical protein
VKKELFVGEAPRKGEGILAIESRVDRLEVFLVLDLLKELDEPVGIRVRLVQVDDSVGLLVRTEELVDEMTSLSISPPNLGDMMGVDLTEMFPEVKGDPAAVIEDMRPIHRRELCDDLKLLGDAPVVVRTIMVQRKNPSSIVDVDTVVSVAPLRTWIVRIT